MEPEDAMLDPAVALTYLAAHTERMLLGTGVIVLPQRNPLVLAKQLASLDVLSGGRLLFGIGAGYLEPELRALGVPMSERGLRTDEYLAAVQALWYEDEPAYEGRSVAFSGIDAHPRPVQRPVPVVVGGHSPAARRRAVRSGHGWFGWMLSVAESAHRVGQLARATADLDRPAALGDLEITVAPRGRLDASRAARYAEAGVQRLVLVPPPGLDLRRLVDFVTEQQPTRLGVS
jgi:probable F420-dependent oxidoreductase